MSPVPVCPGPADERLPMLTIVLLAKEPRPGRSKTRLCPPWSPAEAAALAAAALADTLAAALATPGTRTVVVLDGDPGPWCPPGVPILPQVAASHAERIGAALADAHALTGTPVLLIGMDTPQVTPDLLCVAAERLLSPGVDAALGPACDGGWWALGVRTAEPGLLLDVPMSTAHTGADTRARLAERGLRVADLPVLRDVDTAADAAAVAAAAPGTRFAGLLRTLGPSAGVAA